MALKHYWTKRNKGRMGVGMGVVDLGFSKKKALCFPFEVSFFFKRLEIGKKIKN